MKAPDNDRMMRVALCDRRDQVSQILAVRAMGNMFIDLLHQIGGTEPTGDRMASRDLSLAQTHVEDAVLRAANHINNQLKDRQHGN